jgi:hypothetical protein
MQCDDFSRRLNLLLDQRRPAEHDDALQLHAADCPDCQQLLTGQARLLEMVRYEITPLPDDFGRRLVALHTAASDTAASDTDTAASNTATLQVRPQRLPSRKAQIIAAIVATAATLLIVAAPIANRFSNRQVSSRQGVKIADRSRQAPPATIANMNPGVSQSTSGTTELPSPAAEPEELRRMIHDLWRNLPQVPEEQLEPIDRLAGGFRPLASTLGAAFDAIRRSLPVGRDQEATEPQAIFLGENNSIRFS